MSSNNETHGEHNNDYRISNADGRHKENTNPSTKENHYVLVEHRAEFLEWGSQSLNQRGQDDTISKQTGDETGGSLNKPRTEKLEKIK
ncbi:hypothetical protein E5D57_013338 [Metarhizium anisopliae]|nr:hypothetical protein E5D57_013338 [Metarhizium anisopliae]